MAIVKIERLTHRYRRSVNGAWLGNGTETDTLERDEEVLRHKLGESGFSIGDGIRVTWPDGVAESAFEAHPGCTGYPPSTIPIDGRLAALMKFDMAANQKAMADRLYRDWK